MGGRLHHQQAVAHLVPKHRRTPFVRLDAYPGPGGSPIFCRISLGPAVTNPAI
jgi:hypothetical protein